MVFREADALRTHNLAFEGPVFHFINDFSTLYASIFIVLVCFVAMFYREMARTLEVLSEVATGSIEEHSDNITFDPISLADTSLHRLQNFGGPSG